MYSSAMPPNGAPIAITPSDVTVYDPPLMGFYVEVTGDVIVRAPGTGNTQGTYSDVIAGVQYAQQITQVMAATTATIKGLR